ncbi:MAG: TIR domain-containing protein [Alphaproteobacteria bacterium]|nr:MAG: TIR domain-containing protein [Alphaproteobacteria bacterium]
MAHMLTNTRKTGQICPESPLQKGLRRDARLLADIFISYASRDLHRVEPVVRHLAEAGYSVWWDRKLQGGTMFSREIEAEVQKAKVVIVVWSPASLESRWVADEVDLALQTGKLVPIAVDGVKAPMGFRQIQTIDFSSWGGGQEPCLETLLNAVTHHMAGATPETKEDTPRPAREINEASIAVLPFVDMSPEKDQEYFTDGISEELLNLLAKIPHLQVTARTSSFSFKNSDKQLSEIGEILGVAHILEGSMRKAGNRIRVTAQLIRTDTNFHVWSETYNGTLDDIFEVQDEIAASIVKALKEHLLGDIAVPEAQSCNSVEAYELYIKGQQLLTRRVASEMEEARDCFEQALQNDPNYAPAMVGLADAHFLLSESPGCYGKTPVFEAAERAMPLLKRALEIDPNLAEAYTIRSMGRQIEGRHEDAIADAQKATELNPNSVRAWRVMMQSLVFGGDPKIYQDEIQSKTLQLDPLSRVDLFNSAGALMNMNKMDEANELLARIRQNDSSSQFANMGEIILDITQGNYKEVLRRYLDHPEIRLGQVGSWGLLETLTSFGYAQQIEHLDKLQALQTYCVHGNLLEANRLGEELERDAAEYLKNSFGAAIISFWHSLSGRYERVLEILGRYIPEDPEKWGPLFNPNDFYYGARLCFLAAIELEREDLCRFFDRKIEELVNIMEADPDGTQTECFRLKAILAASRGNTETALTALESYFDRLPILAIEVAHDETFKSLSQEPRFLSLIEKCRARIASEKLAAFEAGLLPPGPQLTQPVD